MPASGLDEKTSMLPIAYHSEWEMYQTPGKNFSDYYLPFMTGKKIENKQLINNWANGWTVNKIQDTKYEIRDTIVIIFWPQYLEFIGFALIFVTFIGLSGYMLISPKKDN